MRNVCIVFIIILFLFHPFQYLDCLSFRTRSEALLMCIFGWSQRKEGKNGE